MSMAPPVIDRDRVSAATRRQRTREHRSEAAVAVDPEHLHGMREPRRRLDGGRVEAGAVQGEHQLEARIALPGDVGHRPREVVRRVASSTDTRGHAGGSANAAARTCRARARSECPRRAARRIATLTASRLAASAPRTSSVTSRYSSAPTRASSSGARSAEADRRPRRGHPPRVAARAGRAGMEGAHVHDMVAVEEDPAVARRRHPVDPAAAGKEVARPQRGHAVLDVADPPDGVVHGGVEVGHGEGRRLVEDDGRRLDVRRLGPRVGHHDVDVPPLEAADHPRRPREHRERTRAGDANLGPERRVRVGRRHRRGGGGAGAAHSRPAWPRRQRNAPASHLANRHPVRSPRTCRASAHTRAAAARPPRRRQARPARRPRRRTGPSAGPVPSARGHRRRLAEVSRGSPSAASPMQGPGPRDRP